MLIDVKTEIKTNNDSNNNEPPDAAGTVLAGTESRGIRRTILIVEDNWINREMLSAIVSNDYDVIAVENGMEALEALNDNLDKLSLILLDMHMPVMDGFEFLRLRGEDELFKQVPVIVTTGSDNPDDEVTCLELGASDFVTKPYKNEVVLSRVKSIISLHESETTLSAVKYDALTGLYTRSAFIHYADIMLKNPGDKHFDVFIADIVNLRRIEAVFGERKSNEIIGYFGKEFSSRAREAIGFRQNSQFIFMLVHDKDRHDEMDYWIRLAHEIEAGVPVNNVQVRYGLYFDVDRKLSIHDICERARITVDSVSNNSSLGYAVYDDRIAEAEFQKFRMEEDFEDALKNNEFVIYLQPKYNLRKDKTVGAEALVRWKKSDGSMVSPGAFIPLFESDGRIVKLDEYIFRKVCDIQKARLDSGLPAVRISVNLSRATLISEGVVDKYAAIVSEMGIPYELIAIELTESFALENMDIKSLAKGLSDKGFRLDMDDFGSGYSSMSSLVNLPFNVVKLDKSLIDKIGDSRGEIIIKHAIDIAHELGMSVVAEGVELREQVGFLRSADCDNIQGYYFGRPMPNEEFYEKLKA